MDVRSSIVFFLALVALAGLLGGCAAPSQEAMFKDSNQVFLESTVAEVDIVGSLARVAPTGSSVCVASLETERGADIPVVAMLEDRFVEALLAAGYSVVERDDDLLKRMASEQVGDGYTMLDFHQPEVRTTLRPADYIASYRVLESGLIYRKASKQTRVAREGMVRLHLRVQDSNSGEILLARTIEGTLEDEIDRKLAPALADFHYTQYSARYPVQRGPDVTPMQVGRGGDGASGSTGPGGVLAALMSGLGLLLLLNAGK